jgi:hypothetical protein
MTNVRARCNLSFKKSSLSLIGDLTYQTYPMNCELCDIGDLSCIDIRSKQEEEK